MRKLLLLLAFVLIALPVTADDGAASIAAGGLVLMKREPRIVMAKEVLSISPKKVVVDYDFRNDSDENITTEVAFPIPAYTWDDAVDSSPPSFNDFHLEVSGNPVRFATEVRAFVSKREVTQFLAKLHVDAATFGHSRFGEEYTYETILLDLKHADPDARRQLTAAGAIKDGYPAWRVEKKYHWTQTFPARATVHIRHEYTPVTGNSNTIGDPANYQGKDAIPEYVESCPTPELRGTLSKIWNKPGAHDEISPLWISYVSFILTTANTWKTPIEDFTLIVERAKIPGDKYRFPERAWVSFCWDGAVTKIDDDHFSAHLTNFVPNKELQIGYIFQDRMRDSSAK